MKNNESKTSWILYSSLKESNLIFEMKYMYEIVFVRKKEIL
jgi:hypothetical protein